MQLISAPQVTNHLKVGTLDTGIPWIRGGRKTVTLSRSYLDGDLDSQSEGEEEVEVII